MRLRAGLVLLLAAGCSPVPATQFDGGMPIADAGPADAGPLDAGPSDAGLVDAGATDGGGADAGWVWLFNGADLAGWDKYLGKPTPADPPLGLNNDPRNVFTVVMLDGEPAIHVTGEVWGALVSQADYGAFDLHAEYKWGTLFWPPLNYLDSGIMYLTTGPYGAVNAGGNALSNPPGSGAFQVSMEYQLAPGDIGGIYNLGPVQHVNGPRNMIGDLPGAWNVVDLHVRAHSAEHFLNGVSVASATGFQLALPGQPVVGLARGKLQLQCEGGEIYFRRIRIYPLD